MREDKNTRAKAERDGVRNAAQLLHTDVARQDESRYSWQRLSTQACTRTQNRIVLGTSREHMLEFA